MHSNRVEIRNIFLEERKRIGDRPLLSNRIKQKARKCRRDRRQVRHDALKAGFLYHTDASFPDLSFSVHLPARAASAPLAGGIEIDEAGRELRVSSIPTRRKNKVSADSTASSIFSPNGTTESLATERPFSALGHHIDQENRHLSHTRTRSGPSSDILSHTSGELVIDEEELERLAWEKHPPLTPRGSLVQAREELAQQQKDRLYWNVGEPTSSATYFLGDEVMEHSSLPGDAGHNSHLIERDLHAIVEESDEEASLRRANSLSNRHTASSRQSSLRRTPTPGTRLDDGAGIPVIEERSEHGQFPST